MSMPIVSIVMPMYNVEKYVSAAIESVLCQSLCDWELLVVDDGSTDNSNAVAQKYASLDRRIKVLHKENGGLSDARNYGLEHAHGKYIHFFDSDDLIQPDFYEKMLSAIIKGNYDFVICGYFKDVENIDGTINSYPFSYNTTDSSSINECQFFDFYDYLFNYAWNKVFSTLFLKQNRLEFKKGLSIIEDKEFMSKVMKYSPSFFIIDYVGYRYQLRNRITLNNQFTSDFVETHLYGIEIQNQLFNHFCKNEDVLNQQRGKLAIHTAMWIFNCISKSHESKKSKISYIKLVVEHSFINRYAKFYCSKELKGVLLRFLLGLKNPRLIYYIYKYR